MARVVLNCYGCDKLMEIFGGSNKREKRKTKFTCFYCCYPRDATDFGGTTRIETGLLREYW